MAIVAQPIDQPIEAALIKSAIHAQANAYCPYSHYPVGAALLTKDNTIINGCNVENAAYGSTICAERVAIGNAVVNGHKEFKAVVVVTKDGKGFPCGACRQVLNEFSPEMIVLTVTPEGKVVNRSILPTLLPEAFGPQNL